MYVDQDGWDVFYVGRNKTWAVSRTVNRANRKRGSSSRTYDSTVGLIYAVVTEESKRSYILTISLQYKKEVYFVTARRYKKCDQAKQFFREKAEEIADIAKEFVEKEKGDTAMEVIGYVKDSLIIQKLKNSGRYLETSIP